MAEATAPITLILTPERKPSLPASGPVAVVLETFTFLDRNATRDVALAWKGALKAVPRLKILPCTAKDLERAWPYFERTDLHKRSAVDAISFVLMTERRIRVAFAFDAHFATAGFRVVG